MLGGSYAKPGTHGRASSIMLWLCVALVLFCGTLQAVHVHPADSVFHADCSLCVTAHVTVQTVQSPAPAPPVKVIAVLETTPAAVIPAALSTFALFTRPPPQL
jgi:hypothetical protein